MESLLEHAEASLHAAGLEITEEDGRLQRTQPRQRGPKASHLSSVVRGLYSYLRPIYKRTFGNDQKNPQPLREHISDLLSPFFSRADISSARKGPIASVIDKFVHANPPSSRT